ARIVNIDDRLCNIESHLEIDSTSGRHLYPNKETIVDPSAHVPDSNNDWEISEADLESSFSASRNTASRRGLHTTPTDIERTTMEYDELNHSSYQHAITELNETKSALQNANAANTQLRADFTELQHNLILMQNEISRLTTTIPPQ